MFSQYSWWDFINVVLALVVPYYGYVLWTYYREDIREWISNRGQRQPTGTATAGSAKEEDKTGSTLFAVNDYRDPKPVADTNSQVNGQHPMGEWLPEPVVPLPAADPVRLAQRQQNESGQTQLQGPAVGEETETVGFALLMQRENPEERSVDKLEEIAQRLTEGEPGLVKPIDSTDQPAARLADIINQQRVNPLSDVAFTR